MFITALDIGSYKIKAFLAEIDKNRKPFLIDVLEEYSSGVRKGEIVDVNEILVPMGKIFEKIKAKDKAAIKNIFVNVGGANIKCQNSRGIIAVSRADNEISQDDIDRVVKASQAIKLLPNRMIIHNITREYIIDGINDVREPLGMSGTRLEVNSLVIDVFSLNVKNILNSIESLGGGVGGLVYNPLAASRSILTKSNKDLGVVLIDIGAGTTSMSVYEEGKLVYAMSFPIGSSNITNDLAVGLKCSVALAEIVKIFFGRAISSEVPAKGKITLQEILEKSGFEANALDKNFKSSISAYFVAEIIESRLEEIFEFINRELKIIGKHGQLPAGAILCGGGAKIPGIIDLAKKELKISSDIGLPETKELEIYHRDFENYINEPEFATVTGLLYCGMDQCAKESGWLIKENLSFKKVLKYFMP
ncbi:MAG: cell division protein FtsA [Patescibacteria group bacterium]